jgi:hypothetical protein
MAISTIVHPVSKLPWSSEYGTNRSASASAASDMVHR